jgi:penicillin amidase
MFPGVPGIIVGFNDHIAWGYTNTGPDVQDLYILELNPANPQQYLYMGEWVDAEIIIEKIQVKGEPEPRQIEVMETHFGPVISSVVDLDIPLSLSWVTLDGTREIEVLECLMRAQNWEQFTNVLENFMSPTQNIVYADREGNIGYRANGLIPIRRSGCCGWRALSGWRLCCWRLWQPSGLNGRPGALPKQKSKGRRPISAPPCAKSGRKKARGVSPFSFLSR